MGCRTGTAFMQMTALMDSFQSRLCDKYPGDQGGARGKKRYVCRLRSPEGSEIWLYIQKINAPFLIYYSAYPVKICYTNMISIIKSQNDSKYF